jgi:DNA helicase-2/ATP-dependent DNA helicase PcrA
MKPNEEQERIVNYFTNGSNNKRILLVEAPPGTGKTFTAVATAINWIDYNFKKYHEYNKKILILTFSKNARAQIEKQFDELKDNNINLSRGIEITNFHSFFQRYVWAYSNYLGLKEKLIIVSPKQRREQLSKGLSLIPDFDINDEDQYNWAESLLEGEFYPLTYKKNIKPSVRKLIPYKEDIKNSIKGLNKKGYIGFSDIGYYMKELLKKSPQLLSVIQNKYNLVILDEYQDASDLQDEIVKMIIGDRNKAIFFADPKQMIYEWRGASPNRLNDLIEYYNGQIEKKELIKSMRFSNRKDIEDILKKAREGTYNIRDFNSSKNIKFIAVKVKEKNLYSKQAKNSMYATLKFAILKSLPNIEIRKNKSIGILCIKNEQVIYIKKAFREEFGVPSKVINNNEEEHNMVCDLINFLSMQGYYIDRDELCRNILKFVFTVIYDNNIGSINRNKLENIGYKNLKNARLPFLRLMAEVIEEALNNKDYLNCLKKIISMINSDKFKVNYDMLPLMKKILLYGNTSADKITELFLQHQYANSFKNLRGIYVLNVHQSKGREFDYVYIVDRESISRENNLLYVALSRVKEKLTILDWVI